MIYLTVLTADADKMSCWFSTPDYFTQNIG